MIFKQELRNRGPIGCLLYMANLANMAMFFAVDVPVMMQVKISELKNGLSSYLRKVKSGESVLVLDRNTPVARLVPIESMPLSGGQAASGSKADRKKLENEALLAKLESKGVIARRRGPSPLEVMRERESDDEVDLVGAVLEERDEDYATGYR